MLAYISYRNIYMEVIKMIIILNFAERVRLEAESQSIKDIARAQFNTSDNLFYVGFEDGTSSVIELTEKQVNTVFNGYIVTREEVKSNA